MHHLLSLQGITKKFGKTQALDNVNLKIPSGQRTMLLGGSGAGKSTLLRIIAGLETPEQGLMRGGEGQVDLTNIPAHLRGVALVAQDYPVYPQLSVERNLLAALEPLQLSADQRRDRLESALDWFQLQSLRLRRPAQLSGGELQRTALARAMVRRPQLLLLDEPLSQLDPALREQSRDLIVSLTQQFKTTLLMVTHDPLDALRLADHLVVLEKGVLMQADSPEAVYRGPRSRSVAEMLSPFGINQLTLVPTLDVANVSDLAKSRTIFFRPESGQVVSSEVASCREPLSSDAVTFEGSVVRLQLLGFATLAYVSVRQGSPAQTVKILLDGERACVGQRLFIRVPASDLLLLGEEQNRRND